MHQDKFSGVVYVNGFSIPDLWFQTLVALKIFGTKVEIDVGSFEKEHHRVQLPYFLGFIKDPSFGSGTASILPSIPTTAGVPQPADMDYVYGTYVRKLLTGEREPNEEYTYGERIEPQIEKIISKYKKGLNGNQFIIQVARPEDIDLKDPPCLRHIDTKVVDNKLWFYIYFRSWDAWNGLPVNLAGIEYLQKLISQEIGVEQGPFIVDSKGIHIYDYMLHYADYIRN